MISQPLLFGSISLSWAVQPALAIGWSELFFDLLFVAVASRVAHLLKYEVSNAALLTTALYCMLFFFSWLDISMFFTRFDSGGDIYTSFVLCLMAGSILTQGIFTTSHFEDDSWKFSVASAISQLAMSMLYISVAFLSNHDRPKPLGKAWAFCYMILCVVWFLAAMTTYVHYWGLMQDEELQFLDGFSLIVYRNSTAIVILWCCASASKVMFGTMLWRFPATAIPINVHHSSERYGNYVLILLGESVISLIEVEINAGVVADCLVTVSSGFIIVFALKLIYFGA